MRHKRIRMTPGCWQWNNPWHIQLTVVREIALLEHDAVVIDRHDHPLFHRLEESARQWRHLLDMVLRRTKLTRIFVTERQFAPRHGCRAHRRESTLPDLVSVGERKMRVASNYDRVGNAVKRLTRHVPVARASGRNRIVWIDVLEKKNGLAASSSPPWAFIHSTMALRWFQCVVMKS